MAAFSTAALLIGAAAIGGTIYQGQQQREAAKQAVRSQEKAQQQAQSEAIRQRRENEMALNKANRKQPDLLGLLEAEQAAGKAGSASTMLTGRRRTGLGSPPTLLGE